MNKSFLHTVFLNHQRVFVRADLNVPIAENGSIKSDKRLRAIIPTINHIQAAGGKVILASHIGRPTGNSLERHLSTRNLISWFEEQGFTIDFEKNLSAGKSKSYKNPKHILLLENLRFFAGEKNYSLSFAHELADLADIYVNDAFGTIHRKDTSVSLVPQLFLPQNRGWGLLIDLELHALESLHDNPIQPFVLALGGAKIIDKIPLINNFLAHHVPPKSMILGGKIAFPFLAKRNQSIGSYLPTNEEYALAQQVVTQLKKTELLLPVDFTVHESDQEQSTTQIKTLKELTAKDTIVDIGPETINLFSHALTQAKTVFVNGTMGINQVPSDSAGTQAILHTIADINGHKIVGGGDAVAAVEALDLAGKMTFLSTGGGATLAYLSSENPWAALPGLQALGPIG